MKKYYLNNATPAVWINKNLPTIYALIDKYKDGKTVVVFKSREEADASLNEEKL